MKPFPKLFYGILLAATMFFFSGSDENQGKEEPANEEVPKYVAEVLDATKKGLMAAHRKRGLDHRFRITMGPTEDSGWTMQITFLPATPSWKLWVFIDKSGEVEVSDGL